MQTIAFTDLVRRIRNAYGLTMYRKKAGEEHGEICEFLYEQVGHKIPSEAADWIYDSILRENERLPQKFHITLGVHLSKWFQAHSDKVERREFKCRQVACKDGFLFVRKESYRYIFRCMECDSRPDYPAIPGNTLHGLELAGYEPDTVQTTLSRKAVFEPGRWKRTIMPRVQEIIEEAMPF